MAQAQVGMIGLGVMGSNLALNIAEHGFEIAVFNRTTAKTNAFYAGAGALQDKIVACQTLKDLVAAIAPPRPVIIMVQAGDAVDEQIVALGDLLEANDIVIDAGNANFRDTQRRFAELEKAGLTFIGMGVSGGEEGARHGPSIMVGGTPQSWEQVAPMLTAISAKFHGEPCAAYLGTDGAGHFVKTIHNGIEYADMQMIAEVYGVMRDGAGMSAGEIGAVFAKWDTGRLDSFLTEITAKVLMATDPATGKPVVDVIVDRAGQKGTGRWSVIEAQMMGVPATAIEAAVAARSLSAMKQLRQEGEAAYGAGGGGLAPGPELFGELELALFAGKIGAYAQGFAVMRAASDEFGWQLPMGVIAKIWRAGCIIRSQFLDDITGAFDAEPDLSNLLVASHFITAMKQAHPALRKTVATAAAAGLPVPALSSALAYFDGFRQGRGTANLVQAQRDFFGAHSFERIDAEGAHHGPWGSGG